MEVLKQINQEVQDFKTKQIQIVPGFTMNQYDILNRTYFYFNSKFTNGGIGMDPIDEDGDRKYFHNIVKNPCKVFSKAIDFDTKNIRLLTAGGGDPLKTWFMERDLKFWMRDKQFGKVLNRLFKELPIFGSVVIKIVDGYPYFVDLRNFVIEQGAESILDSNYVTEIHNYTPGTFRKVAKEMGWNKVDEVIRNFRKMKGASHIRVYERYGEVEEGEGNEKKYTYKRVFIADVGVDEYDSNQNLVAEYSGVELSSDEWDQEKLKNLYWEFHAEKIPGRWLGIGVVETLFEPQIRINELSNLQSKASYWAALRVFQSRDNTINRNMLTDVRNGEIISADSEITPVNMEERNLAFFNEETQKWLRNRDELSFSYDAVQGERSPAGTPLGSVQIAVTQTLSYFEQIQEDVAMTIKEMLYGVIIPQFQKENNSEHTLRIVGQDLDQYVEMVKNELVLKEMIRQITLNPSKFPTNQDRDVIGFAIEESIKQGKERLLNIPKDFYKNVKYDVDIDITGESTDTRVKYATLFALLQAITADPSMTVDPTKRKFLFLMAEHGGVNPNDLFDVSKKTMDQALPEGRAGGGVSSGALQMNIPGQTTQTL